MAIFYNVCWLAPLLLLIHAAVAAASLPSTSVLNADAASWVRYRLTWNNYWHRMPLWCPKRSDRWGSWFSSAKVHPRDAERIRSGASGVGGHRHRWWWYMRLVFMQIMSFALVVRALQWVESQKILVSTRSISLCDIFIITLQVQNLTALQSAETLHNGNYGYKGGLTLNGQAARHFDWKYSTT